MPFDTPLTPTEEQSFSQWKQRWAPLDSGHDYDLRGAFKAGLTPDPLTGHWPDTYKKPNHPTFSDQSIYSSLVGTRPGTWRGETYIPFGSTMPQQQPRVGYQNNPQLQALRTVIDAIRAQAGSGTANPSLFHEPTVTAGAGVQQGLQGAGDVLADPRNAWLGFGPIAGVTRGIRPFKRGWEAFRETGGFTPPIGHLPDQKYLSAIHEYAKDMHPGDGMYLQSPDPDVVNDIYKTTQGLRQLKAERDLAMFGGGNAGGGVPPRSIMEDLKDKYGFGDQSAP